MTYKMPNFRFTHAAQVFAAARGESDSHLLSAAQEGVVDLMGRQPHEEGDEGPDDPMKVFFHCFSYHGTYNMIMSPSKTEPVMIVDCSESEEHGEIKEGPLKGRKIIIPRPFSEDE